MAFKEVICDFVRKQAEDLEETTLEAALQQLHDTNLIEWEAACAAGLAFASNIKTSSKFVSSIIEGLTIAIKDSQAKNPA